MPTRFGKGMALAGLALGLAATPAIAADTIKIAFIDPLSGMMAPIGEQGLADYRYMAERINARSEEHTSELQSLMRISYAVFCLKKKKKKQHTVNNHQSRYITTRNK